METPLDAEVNAGNATRKTHPVSDPTDPLKKATQDQLVYEFKGDADNPGQVMYAVELKTGTGAKGQDGVAFKVDNRGNAIPKNDKEIKNPYSPSNPTQWKAFEQRTIALGHRQGKP